MNPYEILGVDRNASPDEIKKSYRKLSKTHHPDIGGDEEKFKEIASAYDILSTPEKKQQYDTFGTVGNQPGGGNPFGNMEDLLSQINTFNKQKARRGNNVDATVKMSLMDILLGASKTITYTRNVKCEPCNGKGGEESTKCNTCGGSGQTMLTMNTIFGIIQHAVPCATCNSTGYIIKNICKSCKGSGVFPKIDTVNVTIPAGVSHGMQLNMQGSGNVFKDGISGNLIIRIEEIADANFKREMTKDQHGNDIPTNNLTHELWISISEAVLGTSKIVKAPLGDLKFNIEAGCDSGKVFNFNGKGIPLMSQDGRGYGAGNLLVKVNVKIPKKVSDEIKVLFEELKKFDETI